MNRLSLAGYSVIFLAFLLVPSGAAHADMIGDQHSFHTEGTFDSAGAATIPVTLRAIGQNAYFYVDDRAWAGLSSPAQGQFTNTLNQLVADFDSAIYPRATAFWGSEAKPGVDGDPRVTILIESLTSGFGGYFSSINEYTTVQAPQSNAREMFVVSFDSILHGNTKSFMAHEFQHLISFNQKELIHGTSDDTWLNEGRSEYDITVAGYNSPFQGSTLQQRMDAFLRAPSDSLTDWPNTTIDYAITTMFAHYLVDQYGPQIMAWTIHSFTNGAASVDEWLTGQGSGKHFADVFTDWMVAARINDPSAGSPYAYTTVGLTSMHVAPQQVVTVNTSGPTTMSTALSEWQPSWVQFVVPPGTQMPVLNIQISGQGPTQWSGADIATYADGHRRIISFTATNGQSTVSVPMQEAGSALSNVVLALTQGTLVPVDNRQVLSEPVTVTALLGDMVVSPVTPTPPPTVGVKDGDLIRHGSEAEIYVVWGKYRRYLPQGVLALYGFQNRPIISVSNEVFDAYTTSNYVRANNGTKVYALWPDLTKHWLNITPAQWDASGRDWNAIFIVNDAEVDFYKTGVDITR